ncbi:MAG TPA: hypothetical protein VHO91_24420 [Rhodopila sp.]|nr:hypothetical protein [Rhodopila sp.]
MSHGARWLLAIGLLTVASRAAAADPAALVRSGDHLDYGRIVVETTSGTAFHLTHDGDHVRVQFGRAIALGQAPAPPRNVRAVSVSGSTLNLTLADGARVHAMRLNGRVVLDIMDPVKPSPPSQPAPGERRHPRHGKPATKTLPEAPPAQALPAGTGLAQSPELGGRRAIAQPAAEPSAPKPAPLVPVQAEALAPHPDAGSVQAAEPAPATSNEPVQPLPPGRDVAPEVDDGPVALLAHRVRLPRGTDGVAFLAPFPPATGAAVFQDRDGVSAVFDQRRPIDVTALRGDPTFSTVSVQLLANGTLIHVPLPAGKAVSLTPFPRGWRIAALPAAPRLRPIPVNSADGALQLVADDPGAVVTMADPVTGATLLVGTQRRPGWAVLTPRRTAEFHLRPTLQGIVLEALSDRLNLKRIEQGFLLSGGPGGLYVSPPDSTTSAMVDAGLLTRRFDFPGMKRDGLLRLLTRQVAEAAAAPPLARGPLNERAAKTMLALGMGVEAQSLLHIAADQDPHEAASADNLALGAIAALLAGRTNEAEGLTDRRLDGTDEITLWRAIWEAMLDEGSPGAAAMFGTVAPLAFTYPDAMRDHILPLILETMVQGGAIQPAKRLLALRQNDPKLAYARALLLQAEGNDDAALTALDALAGGRDAFDRGRAAVRAVQLRLATHKITQAQAADALDKLLYTWRGDSRELALREQLADLRAQQARWADALRLLRHSEADFPDKSAEIHERLLETFAAMVHDTDSQHLRPLEFVSLVDENADLLGDSAIADGVNRKLAQDLLALDLPQKAQPVLEKLLKQAVNDTAKGRYGLSLATVHAQEGDPASAIAALDDYHGEPLPADISEQRLLLRARMQAQLGDTAAAVAALAADRSSAAAETRAQILENVKDWPAAERAWADAAALTVPQDGPLTDVQSRLVLRLATATARAKDSGGLTALDQQYQGRIAAGPLADMFHLLTAQPVQTAADIARSGKEASLAAALPGNLAALKADPTPR